MNLPTDINTIIYNELETNDLISLYLTNSHFKNELNKRQILNILTKQYGLYKAISFGDFVQKYYKMITIYNNLYF